jgi:hypothetical protein
MQLMQQSLLRSHMHNSVTMKISDVVATGHGEFISDGWIHLMFKVRT